MAQDTFNNDVYVAGALSCRSFSAPAGSITNTAIQAAAAIDSTKLVQRNRYSLELFGPAVSVAALTKWLHILRSSGTIVAIEAAIAVVATGADRTVTVDLQKSTGGAAFATVLSGTIGFNNGSTVRTPVVGTISSASLSDNDILQLVVTVAGAAGAQATGLTVTVTLDENPQ